MPPTAGVRKSSTTTTTTTTLAQPNDAASATRRTTSGRAVRANNTRPTNYYARPFASSSYNNSNGAFAASQNVGADIDPAVAPGFFPALQYLSDAMTALPKEVMRHFTLMKEVEAKIHGPGEKLGELLDDLITYPVPSRQNAHVATTEQGLLSFTANNSVTGSASVSLINGSAPPPNGQNLSAPSSVPGSVSGDEAVALVAESEEEMAKRRKFHELRALAHSLLPNLDEKNVVLAEANRVLKQQLSRLDSVLPHVDNEISEEARLGSMTHWAYSDNRQKKHAGGAAASRRDVAATNNLAAAASAIHESDIAQARRDAVRDTTREKHKGKSKEHVDSDFEERPKKTHAKIVKNKAAGLSGGGLGNGAPVKKRKLDKDLPASSTLDRATNAVPKSMKVAKDTPRSTPAGEPVKKTAKVKPPPLPAGKKKNLNNSAHGSPALASSPMQATFSAATLEPQGPGRPQSARLKQNTAVTNLRHEKLPDEENGRPTSAPSRVNGEKVNGKRKAPEELGEPERAKKVVVERDEEMKHDEGDMADAAHISRSTSNSGRAGRGSKTGTPKKESFSDVPAMVRSRSTRSMRGNHDESSAEPLPAGPTASKHKRVTSNSHLVKQLAPFNRSPDLDRRHQVDDMDEELESVDGRRPVLEEEAAGVEEEEEITVQQSPPKRRFSSRRGTGNLVPPPSSLPASSDAGEADDGEDATMPDAGAAADDEEEADTTSLPALEPEVASSVAGSIDPDADLDEDEDSEPGDPDDPNETKYCYCNRGSYGDMVACDNADCPREWFHLGCTDLTEPPEEIEKWYCEECKPLFVTVGKGRGKGRGVRK